MKTTIVAERPSTFSCVPLQSIVTKCDELPGVDFKYGSQSSKPPTQSRPRLGYRFGLISVLIDKMQVDTRLLSKLNVVLKVISGLGCKWDPRLKPQNDSQEGV